MIAYNNLINIVRRNLKPDLVIFDCDGVLVDSEPISNQVLSELLTEIGLPTTFEKSLELFLGKSWQDSLKTIESLLGKKPPENLFDEYMKRMFKLFETDLEPIKGIPQVLDNLNFPKCVASSGPYEKIYKTLGSTQLLSFFEGNIFSAVDVKNGKPAPDLFLHAARQMNSDPTNSVVIEDSPAGIEAALKANMKVLAFDQFGYNHFIPSNKGKTFSSMKDLINIIDHL
ncbi:MAG: HAD family hydrolase [Dehalococcoidia bacterium]